MCPTSFSVKFIIKSIFCIQLPSPCLFDARSGFLTSLDSTCPQWTSALTFIHSFILSLLHLRRQLICTNTYCVLGSFQLRDEQI